MRKEDLNNMPTDTDTQDTDNVITPAHEVCSAALLVFVQSLKTEEAEALSYRLDTVFPTLRQAATPLVKISFEILDSDNVALPTDRERIKAECVEQPPIGQVIMAYPSVHVDGGGYIGGEELHDRSVARAGNRRLGLQAANAFTRHLNAQPNEAKALLGLVFVFDGDVVKGAILGREVPVVSWDVNRWVQVWLCFYCDALHARYRPVFFCAPPVAAGQ